MKVAHLPIVAAMTATCLLLGTTLAFAAVQTDRWLYEYGDTVQIAGDEMWPGEEVAVDVRYPDGSPAQGHRVIADEHGLFSDSFYLAEGMPGGIYTVVATGLSSGSVFITDFDPGVNADCMKVGGIRQTPQVSGRTATSLSLTWIDNCANEDRFVVSFGTASGALDSSVSVLRNTTSVTLSGLRCGTTYHFKVEAQKDAGSWTQKSASNEGSGTTSSVSYEVDFLPPFDDSSPSELIVNRMKNGRVVPVNVTIYDSCVSSYVTDPNTDVSIRVTKTPAVPGASDPVEAYADAGASSAGTDAFRFADDAWIYNLDSAALGLVIGNYYRVDVFVGAVEATEGTWGLLQPRR